MAGLVLIPFSVLGFVAGKLTPWVRERIDGPLLLADSATVVGGGVVLFATARSNPAELLAAMGVLGFGVGSFSAAMPADDVVEAHGARRLALGGDGQDDAGTLTSLALARRRSSETNP